MIHQSATAPTAPAVTRVRLTNSEFFAASRFTLEISKFISCFTDKSHKGKCFCRRNEKDATALLPFLVGKRGDGGGEALACRATLELYASRYDLYTWKRAVHERGFTLRAKGRRRRRRRRLFFFFQTERKLTQTFGPGTIIKPRLTAARLKPVWERRSPRKTKDHRLRLAFVWQPRGGEGRRDAESPDRTCEETYGSTEIKVMARFFRRLDIYDAAGGERARATTARIVKNAKQWRSFE